jgi:hypothetical protein
MHFAKRKKKSIECWENIEQEKKKSLVKKE